MSRFYARYVPPQKSVPSYDDEISNASTSSTKRKHEASYDKHTNQKLKRIETLVSPDDKPSKTKTSNPVRRREHDASAANGNVVLEKYRVTKAAKSDRAVSDVKIRRPRVSVEDDDEESSSRTETGASKKEKKRRKPTGTFDVNAEETTKKVDALVDTPNGETVFQPYDAEVTKYGKIIAQRRRIKDRDEAEEPGTDGGRAEHESKHAGILSKFEKARSQDNSAPESQTIPLVPALQLHGLEPLPQPEQPNTTSERPTYSILPPWQEDPMMVSATSIAKHSSLNLSETMAAILKRLGLDRPLPIQAALFPLLLSGSTRHNGDLCVSAATGSGKTLSYVVPVIEDLENLPGTKLRAVIVVPTRELVKQVRELCESCSTGTTLKFASAVGSNSLMDEQQMLVTEEQVYDPDGYSKWQKSPIDWAHFSLSSLTKKAKDEDPLDAVGYVTHFRSKIDVLVTTPGRLVDHLRSTPGFSLDDVRWLVVDEADRLLNESYQEWAAVVKPALESRLATQEKDRLLRHMRLLPPRRNVTKILLSATMTRDLTKLDALGLHNPKLVVLVGATDVRENYSKSAANIKPPKDIEDMEAFHLPDTLSETAIPIPDGSEKPILLLQLIRNQLGITPAMSKQVSNKSSSNLADAPTTLDPGDSSSSEDTSSDDEDSPSSGTSSGEEGNPASISAATKKRVAQGQQPEKRPRALVFARSTAAAERLSRLLCILDPDLAPRIATLTRSTTSSASSRRALSSFRTSRTSILIATDRASRGLDVPGLEHVVSYDIPNSTLTYVHRVGRTARAGHGGQAWTLIEHREAAWFWREIGGKRKANVSVGAVGEVTIQRHEKVSKLQLMLDDPDLRQRYEEALKQLGEEVLQKPS